MAQLNLVTLSQLVFQCSFKAGLHYSDYHYKVVHFDSQKNIFMFKKALA